MWERHFHCFKRGTPRNFACPNMTDGIPPERVGIRCWQEIEIPGYPSIVITQIWILFYLNKYSIIKPVDSFVTWALYRDFPLLLNLSSAFTHTRDVSPEVRNFKRYYIEIFLGRLSYILQEKVNFENLRGKGHMFRRHRMLGTNKIEDVDWWGIITWQAHITLLE